MHAYHNMHVDGPSSVMPSDCGIAISTSLGQMMRFCWDAAPYREKRVNNLFIGDYYFATRATGRYFV